MGRIRNSITHATVTAAVIAAGVALLHVAGLLNLQAVAARLLSENIERFDAGIAYGPEARQRLDVYYRSAGAPAGPVILFAYGGGWRAGERQLYRFIGTALSRRGFTTVIPDYRLYPDVRFPAFVEDMARAYAWTLSSPVEAIRNDSRCGVVVMGHSAGAHIAAMLAYNSRYLEAAGSDIPRPSAFVGLAGPYAFDPTTWETTKEIFATAPSADAARPVAHVGPQSPPALLFHGTADDVVKPWNAETLFKTLQEANVRAEFHQPEGIGHMGVLTAIAWPLRWRADVLDRVEAFARELGNCDSR